MDRIWLKTDGDKLRALRESSDLDPVELARAVTLTSAHIRQLEQGGDSLFYSQAIKLQVGRRLLRRLGSDLDETVARHAADVDAALDVSHAPQPQPAIAPEPSLPPAADRASRQRPDLLKAAVHWFPAAAATAAVALVVGVLFQVLQPAIDHETVSATAPTPAAMVTAPVVTDLVVPAPVPVPMAASGPANAPASSNPGAKQAAQAAAPASTNKDANEPAVTAVSARSIPNCTRVPRDTVALQPPSSAKPGNYVYLVASTETTLCVVDGSSRVTTLHLMPGDARSVYGPAPWRLHSPALAQLDVYFQGHRMNSAIGSATHVVFTEHTGSAFH